MIYTMRNYVDIIKLLKLSNKRVDTVINNVTAVQNNVETYKQCRNCINTEAGNQHVLRPERDCNL